MRLLIEPENNSQKENNNCKRELQGLNARIEAEKAALEEARKRGDDTKEIQAEIDCSQEAV